MHEHVLLRLHVPVEVHGHEAGQLQEARIDLPSPTRARPGHVGDDVAAEPIGAALLGKRVDHRAVGARVDGTAGQHERQRYGGIVFRLHQRRGGQHRHGRLAHGKHMHVAAEEAEHADHGVDVVVEIEAAGDLRHVARVLPVRDVNLMLGQERLDGAAQERGKVARHGCDQQQPRVLRGEGGIDVALEMEKATEGRLPHYLFAYLHRLAVDPGAGDTEIRFVVAPRGALEHLAGGDRASPHGRVGQWVEGIEEQAARAGRRPGRSESSLTKLIPMVEQHVCVPRSLSQVPAGMPIALAFSRGRPGCSRSSHH